MRPKRHRRVCHQHPPCTFRPVKKQEKIFKKKLKNMIQGEMSCVSNPENRVSKAIPVK